MVDVAPQETPRRHVISIMLENESGALSRVAGLFSARGYRPPRDTRRGRAPPRPGR